MKHRLWKVLPSIPEECLTKLGGYPLLLAQLLYNRGITEPASVDSFLGADERLRGNARLLPDMDKAIARVYRALLSGEDLAIYGDFDCDGVCGTAVLTQGLSLLGGKAIPYLPHRLEEGYGLNVTALENLRNQGITLVITVDCGITAFQEVEQAKKMGLDIIVTDHHSVPSLLPPALAVIDPRRTDSIYPFPQLAGAGVAFKLLEGLFQALGKESYLEELLDLVALGTIADMSPLVRENRYLVKAGLKLINASPRLGIREMITQAGLNIGRLDAEDISWVLAPRLNAAGRVAHASASYNLLMTESTEEASQLALWLEEKNAERQKLTAAALAKAREQVSAQGMAPLLVVADEDYPVGIAGLVASSGRAQTLSRKLGQQEIPVIGRISENVLLLDPRSVLPEEDELMLQTLRKLASK